MKPIVLILVFAASITVFSLSGYALGEILEPFVPNNINEMNNTNEESNTKLDIKWANEKSIFEDEYYLVR